MGGNIGLPILAQDPLPEGGVYVLELSSYQIDLTQSLDCDVAVLLNITPDHLDRYDELRGLCGSKARLFEMQSPEPCGGRRDRAIDSGDRTMRWSTRVDRSLRSSRRRALATSQRLAGAARARTIAQNAAAAIAACQALGVDDDGDRARPAHLSRPAAPHGAGRARRTASSSSTTARRPTRPRPRRRSPPSRTIRWIFGGQAKTDNLDECAPHFGHVRKAYTIGEAGDVRCALVAAHGRGRVRNAGARGEARPRRRRRRATRSCCRRPAPPSTSSGISRRAATRSARWWRHYDQEHLRPDQGQGGAGRPEPLRPLRPIARRPLVLGDRPGPAAAGRGADRRSA